MIEARKEFVSSGMSRPLRYEVSNRITGEVLKFKTGRGALRAMDRIDNAYGAVICTRHAIWSEN